MHSNPDNTKKPFLTFGHLAILSFVFVIIYTLVLILLKNETSLGMIFSDLTGPLIEISVVLSLFYAAKHSFVQGKRVKIAWVLLALAALSYFLGDTIWALLEIGLNQQPFPSVADVFYLSFYPLLVLGIYYLPRAPLKKYEELKLIMDMTIIIVTVGLIFWVFLIMPNIYTNNDFLGSIISVAYVTADLLLLLALIRLMFNSFKGIYRGPLVLVGLSIIVQVVTDSIYSFQSIQGTYTSGGLLDAGWILSFVLLGLAAFLQIYAVDYGYRPFAKFTLLAGKFNFPSYLPLVLIISTYAILVWADQNLLISNFIYVEVVGGFVIFLVLIRQAITLTENKDLYLEAKAEIINREKAERTLIRSRRHFKSIFDNSPIGIFHSSPEGKFYDVNKALAKMLQYESPEELVSDINKKNIIDHYVDKEKRFNMIQKAQQDSTWHFYENQFYRKDGSMMDSELSFRIVRNSDESPRYLEGFIIDTTQRKQAENDIKKSLKEKELLLKEIHHRVKNNLQIISSMLDLQKYYVDNQEAINVLSESQNRVKSMATIHEMLYQSTDLVHINFSDYIYNLVSDLCYAYHSRQNIQPKINVEEVLLNIETAIPCGLIISELVSNSLKYAFPPGQNGEISIDLHEKHGEFELDIRDDGIGFPEDLNYRDIKTSLGLRLVNSLVEQLEGTIELDRSHGTEFRIKFKELDYKKRF